MELLIRKNFMEKGHFYRFHAIKSFTALFLFRVSGKLPKYPHSLAKEPVTPIEMCSETKRE
jgi:hypothetical protein